MEQKFGQCHHIARVMQNVYMIGKPVPEFQQEGGQIVNFLVIGVRLVLDKRPGLFFINFGALGQGKAQYLI